jgi:hypothetical protein
MTYYAEINNQNICFAELETSNIVNKNTMIETASFGYIGKKYVNGVWEDVPVDPNVQRAQLEAQLAAIQAQLANLT